MPPPLALFLTLIFAAYLLWRDTRRAPQVSFALWLPVIWVFLIGSRFLSQWLQILGIPVAGGASLEDGSPIDAVFFTALITAGVAVLLHRRFSLTTFVAGNVWLTIFFLYCLISITWSDFPFVAVKRFVKILGQPVMVLIILTEPDREEALRRVLKRSAYLLLPLSILFIKYYPEFGRGFESYSGLASNRGVALSKNMLGASSFVFGLFFFWNLLTVKRLQPQERREEIGITILSLWMVAWLLSSANSATSLACLAIGAVTMWMLGMRGVSKRYFGIQVLLGIILVSFAQLAFDVYGTTLTLLGRDATLTTRTEMWQDLLRVPNNPLVGVGYESFWLGDRLSFIWSLWDFGPNQAHNGYLETYLNLGWIGVAILAAFLVATFRKSQAEVLRNTNFGRLRLAFLFAILAYNYTEAAFKGLHFMWLMLLLISIDYAADASRGATLRPAEAGTNQKHMNDATPRYRDWRKPSSSHVVGPRVPSRPWRKPAPPAARQPPTVRRWR